MTVLPENFAPYASAKNVLDVITRKRERGLPNPVTPANLETIGIPKGGESRVFRALCFLDLIDAEGQQTPAMERIALASSAEYQGVLTEVIQSAYSAVFTIVDPAQDSDVAISDAFRRFEPAAQRDRMVALFNGLCRDAGIVESQARAKRHTERTRKTSGHQRNRPKTQEPAHTPSGDERVETASETSVNPAGIDYSLIAAVIDQLPSDGRWTAPRRELWLAAVTATTDLMVKVVEESEGG